MLWEVSSSPLSKGQAECKYSRSTFSQWVGRCRAGEASCWRRNAWERQRGKGHLGVRSKLCLPGTMKEASLSCFIPRTTRPLWLRLPAVPAWRTGEACHLSRQRKASRALRQGSDWRGREGHSSFPSPGWPPVTGASLPFQRCMPSHHPALLCLSSGSSVFIVLSTHQASGPAWAVRLQPTFSASLLATTHS